MNEKDELIKKIIPVNDVRIRDAFSNHDIIDSLSIEEKDYVEEELFKMLKDSDDWLIGDTLSYLKSERSFFILKEKLNSSKDFRSRIQWANSIFKLRDKDSEMQDIAFEEFQKVNDKWELMSLFYILVEFKDERINERIKSFQTHGDFLVVHNARQSLDTFQGETPGYVKNRKKPSKPWWKFW